MLSPTSLALLLAVSYALTASAANAPDPCTVKAWVRADDLAPNAVSHGELKVKVIQPCANTVKSVTLRLRLDEYAEESTVSNKTTSGEFWDWQGDAPMAEWISTKHKRTAWKIEKTLSADGSLDDQAQDWKSGVVFPFSVVSPNVNYPAAIHPLIFSGPGTETHRSVFGLGYRYTALVAMTGPDGIQTKDVEVPAGFAAFRPTSMSATGTLTPREVTVKAIGQRNRMSMRCVDGDTGPEDEEAWRNDLKKMTIRVTLPYGGNLIQGSKSEVTVAVVDGGNGDSSTYTEISGLLELGVATARKTQDSGDEEDDSPASRWNRHQFQFKEIHALMWRPKSGNCDRYQTPITKPLPVAVSDTFPRTSPDPDIGSNLTDPPFRIEAYLGITVTEYYDAPHMDPIEKSHRVYRSGERRKAPPSEVGWEFSKCDRSEFHQRYYTARVPVGIIGAPNTHTTAQDEPAIYYLDNGGRVPMPRIASGHLSNPTGISFDVADPVSVRDSTTVPAAVQGTGRDLYGGFGRMESIDAKAGHYVGALWQSRVHGPRASPAPVSPKTTSDQVVLQL